MSFDLVSPIMQAIAYILLLTVLVTYYIKAFRQPQLRRFWLLFALAWTMNLAANIAWIIHFMRTDKTLDILSWIDLFYVGPYILIGFALWIHPTVLERRTWIWVGIATCAATLIVVAFYFHYVLPAGRGSFVNFFNYAAYPILDAGLITLAWIRQRTARGTHWAKIALLLAFAATSYGLGNTFELTGYVFAPVLGGFLQNFFWSLRQIFVLLAALSVHKASDVLDG